MCVDGGKQDEAPDAVTERYISGLLEIFTCTEEIDEALGDVFAELQNVLNEELGEKLEEALRAVQSIAKISTQALGGMNALIRLRYGRDPERDD